MATLTRDRAGSGLKDVLRVLHLLRPIGMACQTLTDDRAAETIVGLGVAGTHVPMCRLRIPGQGHLRDAALVHHQKRPGLVAGTDHLRRGSRDLVKYAPLTIDQLLALHMLSHVGGLDAIAQAVDRARDPV